MISKNQYTVSILIVNFNTGEILKKCINSIFNFEKSIPFEIIIVDQNSTDNSKDIIFFLSKEYKNIKYILNDTNTGFSKGINTAYETATGEFLLILNPDIIFTKPVLENLIFQLKKNSAGAISPLLKGNDGNIQYEYYQKYPSILQFFLFHSLLTKVFGKIKFLIKKYHYDENILKNKKGLAKVPQLPCAFFLVPTNIFKKFGKMNENYFIFFEDMDLSFKINKNYPLYVDCDSEVMHIGGASFNMDSNPKIYGNYMLSYIIFFEQNYNFVSTFFLKLFTLINSLCILFIEKLKQLFKIQDKFRFEKHKFFIKLLIKHKVNH